MSDDRRLPYLDGIRALAVLAVLFYHGGVPWVNGGLLGVDVFFVLSGYLITTLLCREYVARATIALGRFWAARARRLLPALFLVLLGVAAYAWLFSDSINLSSVRGDALSTLFYVSNWHFVLSDQGYFAQAAAPSPLLHTWSLAVEEQYYLIWPLVALFVLRRGGRRALALVAAFGALASALLMLSMYLAGFSADRLYYGTDTRMQALLLGSLLGVLASRHGFSVIASSWASSRRGRQTGAAMGALGALWLLWAWGHLGGQSPFLYEGGFLVVAVGAGAVITAVTSWPQSLLARGLSLRPLVGLGRISYGVYLYHWPLFLALDHAHTGLSGAALLFVRLAVTLVTATLSWRFVEEPIRQRRWRLSSWRGAGALGAALAATTSVVVVATVVPVSSGVANASISELSAHRVMAPQEVSALAAMHAFSTNPERFVLMGDSQALTMEIGLRIDSVRHYGVRIDDATRLGCDFDANLPVITAQTLYAPSSTRSGCQVWGRILSTAVRKDRPQVVGILMGRFELADHIFEGHVVHVGQPAWDTHLRDELSRAVTIASSRGARVVLFTVPYDDPAQEQPNGQPWPENLPQRVNAYNRLIEEVAADHRGVASVINLEKLLDPGGAYTPTIEGVTVRWTDGIHISKAGGEWLQSKILPAVAALGLQATWHPARASA